MPQAAAGAVAAWVVTAVGATGAAAFAITAAVYVIYTLSLSKIAQMMASRPVDAVSPDPALLAHFGPYLRAQPMLAHLPDGARIDCFAGLGRALFNPSTFAAAVIEGSCLEPEYPSGRTLFFYDTSQKPRSGDLAIVDSWERTRVRGYGSLGSVTGSVERKRVQRVKYVERVDDRWLLHSNDGPYWLAPDEKLAARVVQAVVAPEGGTLGLPGVANLEGQSPELAT